MDAMLGRVTYRRMTMMERLPGGTLPGCGICRRRNPAGTGACGSWRTCTSWAEQTTAGSRFFLRGRDKNAVRMCGRQCFLPSFLYPDNLRAAFIYVSCWQSRDYRLGLIDALSLPNLTDKCFNCVAPAVLSTLARCSAESRPSLLSLSVSVPASAPLPPPPPVLPPPLVVSPVTHASLKGPPPESPPRDKRRKASPLQHHHRDRDPRRPRRRRRSPRPLLALTHIFRIPGLPLRLRRHLRRHLQGPRPSRQAPPQRPPEPQTPPHTLL